MQDSEFRIPNGYVRIADKELQINTNPIEGIKRIYQRNKLTTIAFVIIWAIFFIIVFLSDILPGVRYKIIYGTPTLVMFLIIVYGAISSHFDENHAMTIDKNSIERVEYDWVKSLQISKIKIIYKDERGKEKSQHIMITIFGRGEKGRLNNALSVFNNNNIDTKVGTYYTGDGSSDVVT